MGNERKKIIAVDDNVENLTVLKDSMKNAYEVYTCHSAAKMFELLEHIQPDLILLDINMPEMSGYEAAKKLKSIAQYKSIPFMFLTARNDIQSEINGLKLGAADYIHKPFVVPLLLQRIKSRIALADYQKIEIISTAALTAMNHIKEGFVLVDINNNYLASNPAIANMLPGVAKLAKGESIFLAKGWTEELNSIENGSVEFSITDGNAKYFRADISPVFIENNVLIGRIFLFTDITVNVNHLAELQRAAYTDALTGLYNAKHFFELAETDIKRAARANQSVYTAMVDIDSFRNINNTYGYAAGDAVLKSAADIIRQTIRPYDLIGRYGGGKFALLFTISEETGVANLAERIRKNVERVFTSYEGIEIKITCSIGMAKLFKNGTLKSAMQKADEALCIAKNSGRNQVKIYDSKPHER